MLLKTSASKWTLDNITVVMIGLENLAKHETNATDVPVINEFSLEVEKELNSEKLDTNLYLKNVASAESRNKTQDLYNN